MAELSDLEIIFTNRDGSVVAPTPTTSPAFDDYLDKPCKLVVSYPKGHGIDPLGTVQFSRLGQIKLLGHVWQIDESKPDEDKVTCKAAEALLDYRVGQFYRYPAGTTLNSMLSDSLGGSVVGLLAMANRLIPRGSFELHSGAIYKIRADANGVGGGTAAKRFGTITSIYQRVTALDHAASLAAMVAGTWFQDSTDLYVWCTDSANPSNHLILTDPAHKDTLVRLGTIEGGTASFTVAYEISASKILPFVQALLLANSLEADFRPNKDGYVYLHGTATIGRNDEAVTTFSDGVNASIEATPLDGDGELQCILGQGAGAGLTQQASAATDNSAEGTYKETVNSFSGLYGDALQTYTEKLFSEYQDSTVYEIKPLVPDWALSVGDLISIKRSNHQAISRRIKQISCRSGGDMQIQAGQRLRTIAEILKGKQDAQSILESFYGSHTKNAWSWTIDQQNVDSYTPISFSFDLIDSEDNGEIDTNFPFQVLLSLSIGWYTSSTKSGTVGSTSHSSVGSHSGYGNKTTSAETQEKHSVNASNTTGPSSGLFNFYAYSGDSYYTEYASEPGHTYSNSSASRSTGSAEGHTHSYSDYYCSGVWSTGSHRHQYKPMSQFLNAVNSTHIHPIATHNTNDAATQSHTTASESAKTRAGSIAHPVQTLEDANDSLSQWIMQLAVGKSVHYLTLAITCNGSPVPGSPFSGDGGTGLYVGDSLDAIDITDLVVVGQKNTIQVTISEFGGSDPVRCSLSGNVNVNAVISAF